MNQINLFKKLRFGNIGIRWKIFGYMMILLLVLLLLLWIFQVVFFEEIYKSVKIAEIELAAENLTEHCDLESSMIDSYAKNVALDYDVCVMVYEQDGTILSSKHYIDNCSIHRMDDMNLYLLYVLAKNEGGEKLTRYPLGNFRGINYSTDYQSSAQQSADLGESIIHTRVVHSDVRGSDVVIILNTTISPLGSTINTLRIELLIISIAITLAALVLSLFFARRIAKPIIKINLGAKELAKGNFNVNLEHTGYREIVELSDTLAYAAEELSKTERLQRELIANISHDLRTPLTMIEGYAEVMRDLPGENTPENVQIIIDETKRLTSLVNDLLDISRLQSGTGTLELSDFNLTETVREVIGRFSKLTEQDGVVIDFRADQEVIVNADRTRILQVIYNFINNAITHSGDEKKIEVVQKLITDDTRKSVRIEVHDHGEGISPENLPNIWDRYYKVDKLHRRAVTGSGLGLSIVKGILEMHHAKYGVESELGKGSTFWFEL